jgi:2'-5' RNA ligase
MDEPCGRGVSLWLVPEGDARDRLQALIGRLAARFGTPSFPPHVTLLPGIEGRSEDDVLHATCALGATLRPFPVRLHGLEGGDQPFRCLFARAAADEPLLSAHREAAQAFGRAPDPAFLPHLSLVYGTLALGVRESLVAELATEAALSFEAGALHVWRTEGPVVGWREIGVSPVPARQDPPVSHSGNTGGPTCWDR